MLRIFRIVVGPSLILIKNSFCFIMQQSFYPNDMHFQNDRNIPSSTERLPVVVDWQLVKVIRVINLNLNLLSIYCHSLSSHWFTSWFSSVDLWIKVLMYDVPFCAKRRNESSISCLPLLLHARGGHSPEPVPCRSRSVRDSSSLKFVHASYIKSYPRRFLAVNHAHSCSCLVWACCTVDFPISLQSWWFKYCWTAVVW